jgi:hypothetical protein
MSNTSWLANLHLNLAKSNWEEWSFQLKVQSDRLSFTKWLKGTLPQPDTTLYPKAHDIWETNDCFLRVFIFGCISKVDYEVIRLDLELEAPFLPVGFGEVEVKISQQGSVRHEALGGNDVTSRQGVGIKTRRVGGIQTSGGPISWGSGLLEGPSHLPRRNREFQRGASRCWGQTDIGGH